MKCIFCRIPTTGNEPLEHILPESLGNKKLVLRRGIVCGKCNNYFAVKVEKPFLETPSLRSLRFQQCIANKKGRIPTQPGLLLPNVAPIDLKHDLNRDELSATVDSITFESLLTHTSGKIVIPRETVIEADSITSRFLAKVAVEAMVHRIEHNDTWLEEWGDEIAFDPIRKYARYGSPRKWPIAVRRIYAESSHWFDSDQEDSQIIHESDFLYTEHKEMYFVLAIFGQELSINMAGPEIEGWENWLEDNDHVSPLHHGKNAGKQFMHGTNDQ